MNKIIFRVDIGQSIGIGHIRRCEALASAFNDIDIESVFIINKLGQDFKIPYRTYFLSKFYSDGDVDLEINEINNLAIRENVKTIVLDSYNINAEYIARLRSFGFFVVSIDDLADIDFPSNLVINGSAGAKYLDYKSKTDETVFLLGLEYFLLRQEFNVSNYKINNEVNNILITMGGSDTKNNTYKIIKLLDRIPGEFKLKVILGPFYDRSTNIKLLSNDSQKDIEILDSPTDMRPIMESVDLAVSAAGQTIYELCALGVPSFAIKSAINQDHNINELSRLGAIYSIESYDNVDFDDRFINKIRTLIDDYKIRKNISLTSKRLIDGKGSERVANHISKYAL